jgi:hypothetical protein
MSRSPKKIARAVCALCERAVPTTAHHLIPRAVHRKKRFRARFGVDEMRARLIPLCRLCHNAVHEFIPSEKLLAEEYNTVEALLAHEGIARHVAWARRQKGC